MNYKELSEKMKSKEDNALELLANTGISPVLSCKYNFEVNVNNKVTAILIKRADNDRFNEIGEKLNNIITQFSEILDDFIEENKLDFMDVTK